eukprot:3941348-Rhodomonas_salina.3
MSGTDLAYGYGSYVMSGTDLAYGATAAVRCPVLTQRMVLRQLCDVHYAMSGTDLAYGATAARGVSGSLHHFHRSQYQSRYQRGCMRIMHRTRLLGATKCNHPCVWEHSYRAQY